MIESLYERRIKKNSLKVIQERICFVSSMNRNKEARDMTDITQLLSDILNESGNDSANISIDVSNLL